MQNLDIKNFQSYSSVNDTDKILMTKNGADASITIALLREILSRNVKPTIIDGVWHIGAVDTGIKAIGKSPQFQTTANGIEWRYEGDTAWIPLVSYEQLKLKFSDLTPEQFQSLKLTLADLTAEEIAELQRPATETIESVKKVGTDATAAEKLRVGAEEKRVTNETSRTTKESERLQAETSRVNAEGNRASAETLRTDNETTRVSKETERITSEGERTTSETARNTKESERITAESGRVTAETARVTAESERVLLFKTLKTDSENTIALASEVASHPTYVGVDNYVYVWNKTTKAYDKTTIYVKGEGVDYTTLTPEEKNGLKGLSAYDVAVGNGYVGTVEQWLLSLKGDAIELRKTSTHIQWRYKEQLSWNDLVLLSDLKGTDGRNGIDGTSGTNGIDGANGIDGKSVELQVTPTHIQWRLVGSSTWINIIALSSLKGNTGANGINGISPLLRIASDGDWKVSYDNGVTYEWLKNEQGGYCHSRGDKGDTGAQGIKGDTGAQGIQGDTGAQGIQGVQGAKGDRGYQGYSGSDGAKGDKGDKGEKGDTGTQGIQGVQGAKGETGVFDPSTVFSSLTTSDKTVPGAINELNSGKAKTDLSNVTLSKYLSDNGYYKAPDGLLFQWGEVGGSSANKTVYFPTSFRTPFSLITNVINAGGQSVIIESVKFVTTNYFTVQSKYVNPNAAGEAIEGFYWIAIGTWK